MVSIESRKNERELTVTHRVRWREGGVRPTVCFCTRDHGEAAAPLAERFAALVKLNGDRMPTRDQLDPFGLGFVLGPVRETDIAGELTVTDLIERYISHRESAGMERAPIARKSAESYRAAARRYVASHPLGARDARDPELTWRDVLGWQRDIMAAARPGCRKPLGANSANNLRHSVLDAAFRWACSPRSGTAPDFTPIRTATNPCADVPVPQLVASPRKDIVQTAEDYAAMLAAAAAVDVEFAALVALMAATGLRISEATQLRPGDVDLERCTISVWRHWDGSEVVDGDKTHKVRIDVPVPDQVSRTILAPRVARGGPLLFTGPRGRRWSNSTLTDRWEALSARLASHHRRSLHLTNHCMRTAYITLLTGKRMNPHKIALIVGHSAGKAGGAPIMQGRYVQLTEHDRAWVRRQLAPYFATL